MFYGVGISTCAGRGIVQWHDQQSYDAIRAITFAFMPLIPFEAVHVIHNPHNTQMPYRLLPIRWTFDLLIRAFARRWLWGLLALAIALGLAGLDARAGEQQLVRLRIALGLGLLVGVGWWGLQRWEHRQLAIRLILGPHPHGFSDPATWTKDWLPDTTTAVSLYGASTYADAVPLLLARREYSRAMWAARLCVARDEAFVGERLTDEILEHPDVQAALAEVQADPRAWRRVMVEGHPH
jgi:hypothetical protein